MTASSMAGFTRGLEKQAYISAKPMANLLAKKMLDRLLMQMSKRLDRELADTAVQLPKQQQMYERLVRTFGGKVP